MGDFTFLNTSKYASWLFLPSFAELPPIVLRTRKNPIFATRPATRTWRKILSLARRERQRSHAKPVFRVADAQIALVALAQEAQIGVRTVRSAGDRRVAGRKNVFAGVAQNGDVR